MAGIDFLTIAEWAGHADGGILIGKVYGHLNPGHKRTMASQVSFGTSASKTPEAVPANPEKPTDLSKLSVADLLQMIQNGQNK